MNREPRVPPKEHILESLEREDVSPLRKYQKFFVGSLSLLLLLKYEVATIFAGPVPGAMGHLLRTLLYPPLLLQAGSALRWGRNVVLRHPKKMRIGSRCAFDDDCMLDARGASQDGYRIGNNVLVARSTILQAKTGDFSIGNRCVIGPQTRIVSTGGLEIGDSVLISGQCYVGGGRYHVDDRSRPMADRDPYTVGPIVIGDDVWIGSGAHILDGVRIGKGSVIGAGAVVRTDIPEYTIATPHQKLVLLPRTQKV